MGEPDSDRDPLIGEVIANRYQIESRIGEGAMGAVYRARHIKVGRAFAVKVLHARLLDDPKVASRFEQEAELAGRLRHPNVIGVVDVGETQGTRYMVMDFAEGVDLATMLGEAPFTPQRVFNITRQLCDGLYHAHEQGLIHRDFKPENVIIERDNHGVEVPRIVDFGIAILREAGESAQSPGRLTTNGLVLGTPHYMAPEQAVADPIDHRIDLFALGIMMYEMLCGKLPFDGTGAEVARANLMLDPPMIAQRVPFLEVDSLLEAMSRRLMAKSRDLRPPTAKAARDLLDLIDRDRAAAAAALGVPLEVATRMPLTTAPLASRDVRGSDQMATESGAVAPIAPVAAERAAIATPPQAPPMTAPVVEVARLASAAGADASTAGASMAGAPVATVPRDYRTELAEPLTWDGDGPRKSRAPLWGALAAVAAVGVVVVIAVSHGGGDKPADKVASNDTSGKAAQPPTPMPMPTPVPSTPTPVPSTPVPSTPVPSTPVPSTPVPSTPVPVPSTAPTPPPPTPKTHPTPPIPAGSATVAHNDDKGPPPPTPTPAAISAAQLASLYSDVGAEITALKASQGESAANDLISRFGLIRINEEMAAPPARRAEVAASLIRLRREAQSRVKHPAAH